MVVSSHVFNKNNATVSLNESGLTLSQQTSAESVFHQAISYGEHHESSTNFSVSGSFNKSLRYGSILIEIKPQN
jgi:hypothetical protein